MGTVRGAPEAARIAGERTCDMERVRKAHSHSQASLTESVNSSLRLADSKALITCWEVWGVCICREHVWKRECKRVGG